MVTPIDKAISLISPPGVYAGISTTVAGATAITVLAGAGDVVVLKGLSLSGLGLGADGVYFASGKALRVEGLTISGFTGRGIDFVGAATSWLTVSDSLIRDNGNFGIYTYASAGEVRATINRTTLAGNYGGLYVGQGGRVTVRDSVASGNVYGFAAEGVGAALTIENCLASGNQYGIYSQEALVRVAGSTVVQNTSLGLSWFGGGSILSRGNNTVEGNAAGEAFTGAFAPKGEPATIATGRPRFTPLARGGDPLGPLRVLCRRCNSGRGDRTSVVASTAASRRPRRRRSRSRCTPRRR